MPAINLQKAVKSTLSAFLQQRTATDGDIAQDVYRTLRDEASLLLERQLVCDALDTDPFELTRVSSSPKESECAGDSSDDGMENGEQNGCENSDGGKQREMGQNEDDVSEKKKNAQLIARMKEILRVVSCTRVSTPNGYSSIHCIVQLDNDGKMQGVQGHIRLHFTFLREPQHDIGEHDDDDAVKYADADDNVSSDEDGSSDDCDKKGIVENKKGKEMPKQPAKKRKRITKDEITVDDKDETNDETSDSGSETPENQNNNSFTPRTIVTYKINYSIDSGKMEQLLGVDVYALADHPSVEEAIPMMDEDEDAEEDDPMNGHDDDEIKEGKQDENTNAKQSPASDVEFEEIVMSDSSSAGTNLEKENVDGDRFGVFVSPENVVALLDRVNMNLNEQSVFYLLLTFPFYEQEWDIAGFLLSALFDDDDDE